jgi:hypothetical protein
VYATPAPPVLARYSDKILMLSVWARARCAMVRAFAAAMNKPFVLMTLRSGWTLLEGDPPVKRLHGGGLVAPMVVALLSPAWRGAMDLRLSNGFTMLTASLSLRLASADDATGVSIVFNALPSSYAWSGESVNFNGLWEGQQRSSSMAHHATSSDVHGKEPRMNGFHHSTTQVAVVGFFFALKFSCRNCWTHFKGFVEKFNSSREMFLLRHWQRVQTFVWFKAWVRYESRAGNKNNLEPFSLFDHMFHLWSESESWSIFVGMFC